MNSAWQTSIIILVLTLVTFVKSKGHFSYDDQSNWPHEYPQCDGRRQSPINVKSAEVIVDEDLNLQFKKYDEPFLENNFYWVNDGHTFKLSKTDLAETHIISGKALDDAQYRFRQLHVHWGSRNDYGSEHSVDGIQYPLEMHLVHQLLDYDFYPTKNYNQLAVIGLFFVVGKDNRFLQDLILTLPYLTIVNKNMKVNARGENGLIDILPSDLESFYVYNGSLTTPPCNETVRWIIMKEIQEISESQLNLIRAAFPKLPTNSRQQQQRNSRIIYTSNSKPMEKHAPLPSSSNTIYMIYIFRSILFALILSMFNFSNKRL